MKKTLVLAILSAATFAVSTKANAIGNVLDDGRIEGSYIVAFKKPSGNAKPFITPGIRFEDRPDKTPIPFGEHSTGQDKAQIAAMLGLRGKVVSIFDMINAIHMHADESEAQRLRSHPLVERVEQSRVLTIAATQTNPGWALDRFDEEWPNQSDFTYSYNSDGNLREIYVLDTGLSLEIPAVAAEFGGRAEIFWDVNTGIPPSEVGRDCVMVGNNPGHGTQVASIIGGATKGVAKGARLKIAKITNGCTGEASDATTILAFNWLATNAPRGTIANYSLTAQNANGSCAPLIIPEVEAAIVSAFNAGIIVITGAGNDNCNTADFTPARMTKAFVVGATSNLLLASNRDAKAISTRTGASIATFAPGVSVNALAPSGNSTLVSGTSFSTAYLSGLFAVACQANAWFCANSDMGLIFDQMKQTGKLGTVTNPDGTTLTGATSRFIWKQNW